MTETNQGKNSQPSLPMLKQLPVVEIVQGLHTYNVRVAKICRQHSLNLLSNYYQNKKQYLELKQPQINERVKAAAEMGQSKKKNIEIKQKDMTKKNNQNIGKLENMLNQKRQKLVKKQGQMMEQSELRRLQFLKSLRSSFYVSQDKRYHKKQREFKELEKSLQLQKQNLLKAQAADERRGSFLSQLKQSLKRKNDQNAAILQQCREKEQLQNSQLFNKIIERLEVTHKSLQQKNYEAQKKLELKKKESQKNKQKQIKKRSKILQDKQSQLQKQQTKVEAKLSKANLVRQSSLKALISNKNSKRQLKQKQQFFASIYKAKEYEQKLMDLGQKLYSSQQFFYKAKDFKQKLRSSNFYDYCKISHELNQ